MEAFEMTHTRQPEINEEREEEEMRVNAQLFHEALVWALFLDGTHDLGNNGSTGCFKSLFTGKKGASSNDGEDNDESDDQTRSCWTPKALGCAFFLSINASRSTTPHSPTTDTYYSSYTTMGVTPCASTTTAAATVAIHTFGMTLESQEDKCDVRQSALSAPGRLEQQQHYQDQQTSLRHQLWVIQQESDRQVNEMKPIESWLQKLRERDTANHHEGKDGDMSARELKRQESKTTCGIEHHNDHDERSSLCLIGRSIVRLGNRTIRTIAMNVSIGTITSSGASANAGFRDNSLNSNVRSRHHHVL
ncbi:hypothetical protein B0O80DRAFT_425880 [Mortierella sp. GBAus27b]|nr:hypothetical protein B0O80DRAFT_425880 [Mortierella sp. GBAus27b]